MSNILIKFIEDYNHHAIVGTETARINDRDYIIVELAYNISLPKHYKGFIVKRKLVNVGYSYKEKPLGECLMERDANKIPLRRTR